MGRKGARSANASGVPNADLGRRPLQRQSAARGLAGARFIVPLQDGWAWEIGTQGGERREGGLKPPLRMRIGDSLGGDLLGLELAVEGFENPVLEDVAIAGFDCAEDQADAGGAGIKDDGLGFEGFAVLVNPEENGVFQFKGGGGFEEAAHQAELGDASGESRAGGGFRSDLGVGVEGKSQATAFSVHSASLFHARKRVEAVEGQEMRIQ